MMQTDTQNQNLPFSQILSLKNKLHSASLPEELYTKALSLIERSELSLKYQGSFSNIDQTAKYIEWITCLPWKTQSNDNLDIQRVTGILNNNHFGLDEIKERIIEYIAVMNLNRDKQNEKGGNIFFPAHAPILFFVGLVGTGKTTIAKSIAEALGRSFIRIPFGGMGSALDLRGESKYHPEAEPGLIIKGLKRAQMNNPVVLLDELDRIADEARSDIMGVLVELLDPEQNSHFLDHYIDYPFDLSQTLFIATANNTKNIATAVMDRLEPIQMPSYRDEEKIVIAKSYIFPKVRKSCGLSDDELTINDNVWTQIVRPLGFDSGLRTLERNINGICRKVARMIVEKKTEHVNIDVDNAGKFLPSW